MMNLLYTTKKFNELVKSFSLAIFFVLSISLFFLGIRSAIIVTLILPFSICLVMVGCRLIGLPLHMTSITGIIIALGLLIDNGIIVVEDYKNRRASGLSINDSISQGLKNLSAPLAAATATTVFSFLPIVTGEGIKYRIRRWHGNDSDYVNNLFIGLSTINGSSSDELYGEDSLLS